MNTFEMVVMAMLYGVTMKVADLMDEHGLCWFRGDAILFGFLWGVFGSLLAINDTVIASAIAAQNVAYIARGRLDYRNHQIAATMIISTAFVVDMPAILFVAFLVPFIIFGSLRDYDYMLEARGFPAEVSWLLSLYYPVSTLIYCLMFGHWMLFWVFTAYIVSYDVVKVAARNRGYP